MQFVTAEAQSLSYPHPSLSWCLLPLHREDDVPATTRDGAVHPHPAQPLQLLEPEAGQLPGTASLSDHSTVTVAMYFSLPLLPMLAILEGTSPRLFFMKF